MKVLPIFAVLLSIAALALADVVPVEKFQKILDRANLIRAYMAIRFNVGNMHELKYDDELAAKALNHLTCEEQSNFVLLPDESTYKNYYDKITEDEWTLMIRYKQFLYDPRQYKIGCAEITGCRQNGTIDVGLHDKEYYEHNFSYNCAVYFKISPVQDTGIIEGPPGSQCPFGKNELNLCI